MICEKCKSKMIKIGENEGDYICPICDGEPVTQKIDLIEYDINKYVIKIPMVKEYDTATLKEISHLCSCNVLQAKKILEETGFEFKPMDAIETRALKDKIDETKVKYEITPEFLW